MIIEDSVGTYNIRSTSDLIQTRAIDIRMNITRRRLSQSHAVLALEKVNSLSTMLNETSKSYSISFDGSTDYYLSSV